MVYFIYPKKGKYGDATNFSMVIIFRLSGLKVTQYRKSFMFSGALFLIDYLKKTDKTKHDLYVVYLVKNLLHCLVKS